MAPEIQPRSLGTYSTANKWLSCPVMPLERPATCVSLTQPRSTALKKDCAGWSASSLRRPSLRDHFAVPSGAHFRTSHLGFSEFGAFILQQSVGCYPAAWGSLAHRRSLP